MNCLAHAFRFLDDPHFAAGTCVPDWLSMVDRQARIKRKHAEFFLQTPGLKSQGTEIAAGIVQHFDDDDRFHSQTAFAEICSDLSQQLARHLVGDQGMRPRFTAHVMVEMLLDSEIENRLPGTLDRYYETLLKVDPVCLLETINQLAMRPSTRFQEFLPRYMNERFMFDYLEDRSLLNRLNGVLRRVRLAELPRSITDVIGCARVKVHERYDELLSS
jgi:hypothetical protein